METTEEKTDVVMQQSCKINTNSTKNNQNELKLNNYNSHVHSYLQNIDPDLSYINQTFSDDVVVSGDSSHGTYYTYSNVSI